MYKTSFEVSLLVIFLMLSWSAVQAAGLGKLTLNSALGQPLAAEIDIVATGSDNVSSLKAGVATREAFAQAGINYESVLSTIKASVESRSDGNSYIKLTSPQAVNDPFLMILMELSWSSGRILREYTVLLDPFEANTQSLATASANSTPAMTTTRLDKEEIPVAEKEIRAANLSKRRNNSSGQTKNSYGPVKRGDTLSLIARQVSPAGIDLNQMLVALYHANRDAFIADNMNLLKSGAVLKIPEKNEIASIDASAAKAEIKMQTADWRSYRSKLADISRESSAQHTISQSDQGQITTMLGKKSAAYPSAAKEVLKLSSGAQLPDKDGNIADSNLVDRLRMMEEDAIARNLALKEANERVAMLEKNIENLKQLLELKDSVLAQAQLKAERTSKTSVKPEMPTAITPDPAAQKNSKSELESLALAPMVNTPVTQPALETMAKSAPVILSPLPPDTDNQSWMDLLLNYIEYVMAASVLGLSLILLIIRRRRNQQAEAEEVEEKKENFSSTMRSPMVAMSAAEAVPNAAAHAHAEENTENDLTYDEELDKDAKYYKENAANHEPAPELHVDEQFAVNDLQQSEGLVNEPAPGKFAEDSEQLADSERGNIDSADQIDSDSSDEIDNVKHRAAANQSRSEDASRLPEDAGLNREVSDNVLNYGLEINFDDSEKSPDSANLDADTVQEIGQDKSSDMDENSEQWREVKTKLDLAKAYQQVDDKEGAKEMLAEAIRDGDERQKKAAEQMLKSL